MDTYLENTELDFEMTVQNVNGLSEWNEKIASSKFGIPTNNEEAIKIAKKTIEYWNNNLREFNTPRKLINVQRIETKVIDLIEQIDV